ncbi:MAG: hypothetical protein ACT4NJ_07430 [Nitrosopumilaceae archaeon]
MTCKLSAQEQNRHIFFKTLGSFIRYRKIIESDMTLIMGANCQDGAVLVGDKKITLGNGTDFTFAEKIFSPYSNVVVGSSGYGGLYRSFQARLKQGVEELTEKNKGKEVDWQEQLILLVEQVIRQMGIDFGQEIIYNNFQVFLASRIIDKPELIMVGGIAIPQPITTYESIGHGDPYSSVLLKTLWSKYAKSMTMQMFAKIACLAIKYVQDLKLDFSVGIDLEHDDYPQVWYIPKIPDYAMEQWRQSDSEEKTKRILKPFEIKELSKIEVQMLMNYGTSNILNIKSAIENVKF